MKNRLKKFIIITGPMGVGKTTIGKLLCDRLGRTAFIDGDWCIDIHPFVGNRETKDMAIDNIIHIAKNYYKCSESDNIVLSWVMSQNTIDKIILGLSDLDLQICSITLICDKEALINRWHKDLTTEWRLDEWLESSLNSLENYSNRTNTIKIDTSKINADSVISEIMNQLVHLQTNLSQST